LQRDAVNIRELCMFLFRNIKLLDNQAGCWSLGNCNAMHQGATSCNKLQQAATSCMHHNTTHVKRNLYLPSYLSIDLIIAYQTELTMHYNTKYETATRYTKSLYLSIYRISVKDRKHTATHCNTLQHTATSLLLDWTTQTYTDTHTQAA